MEVVDSSLPVCLELTRSEIWNHIKGIVLLSQVLEFCQPLNWLRHAWFKLRAPAAIAPAITQLVDLPQYSAEDLNGACTR